jgi:hypothetical protein
MSLEEVVRAGQNVLTEVENILLIVGDPQGNLDQELRPCPICLLNVFIIILINYIKLYNYEICKRTNLS